MSDNDHSYFLKRALFHRRRLEQAGCPEARLCHAQLVKAYQRCLAEIRGKRTQGQIKASMASPARPTLSLFNSGGAKSPTKETC
ncbi:hypothetical protein [Sphingobium yanoikuyae]|uniref:Uncharacterized protein n=1 Tax=Sphingobium yanoikuyae TaxID=13690 RepID=A0A9X7U5P9_SPHYA|nr:hypothetical protein [Sphingobium yanoikuyae]QNG43490.1 hypothetical protein H3V42_16060 [Sphingobium yanoikuyae]